MPERPIRRRAARALDRLARALDRGSFEAAGDGRRWEGAGVMPNTGAAILAGAGRIRQRAAHLARNNPHAAAAVRSFAANVVGAGIKPRPIHPDPAQRRRLAEAFEAWTDQSDADGLTDWYGQQVLAARSLFEDGEGLGRFLVRPANGVRGVPLRVQLIHPDQLPLDLHRDMAEGARVRAGIEFDANGVRRAYHLYERRPGDGLGPIDTRRVPAAEVLHLFELLTAGQVRGVSWLAPVLLRLHELDGYEDAEAVGHKVRALFAGFIRDVDGSAGGFADGQSPLQKILDAGLQPGTLYSLPPGADITFAEPKGSSSYSAFVKSQLRAIAAGLGITYEQLSGDLENVNYSSIRAGLVEFRRQIEQLQWSTFVFQFCRPTWDRWVRLAILSGAIEAPDFEQHPERYRAQWVTPGWDWVDPEKDLRAELLAIRAGLTSRSAAVAARGLDVESLDAEIAADQARAEALGLDLDFSLSGASAAGGATERPEGRPTTSNGSESDAPRTDGD